MSINPTVSLSTMLSINVFLDACLCLSFHLSVCQSPLTIPPPQDKLLLTLTNSALKNFQVLSEAWSVVSDDMTIQPKAVSPLMVHNLCGVNITVRGKQDASRNVVSVVKVVFKVSFSDQEWVVRVGLFIFIIIS